MFSAPARTVACSALVFSLTLSSSTCMPSALASDDGYTPDQLARGVTIPVGRGTGTRLEVRTGLHLQAGEAVEISARIQKPSSLPDNARLRVQIMQLNDADRESAGQEVFVDKILHALDGDLYTPFRAPRDGRFALVVEPAEDALTLFEGSRWREAGKIDEFLAAARAVAWPAETAVDVEVQIRPLSGIEADNGLALIECEPNDSARYAQQIPVTSLA